MIEFNTKAARIEQELRAAQADGTNRLREFLKNNPAETKALGSTIEGDQFREQATQKYNAEHKDEIAAEQTPARTQAERDATEKEMNKYCTNYSDLNETHDLTESINAQRRAEEPKSRKGKGRQRK